MSIKENVIQFMEGSGYTQKQVAAKSNLSTATVSQYLSGTYKGNISTIEAKLRDFLFREAKRLHGDVEFVPTTLAKTVLEIIDITHSDCDIGVIYGAAGIGKSMALREYALRDSAAILIEADPGYTAKVLLQELCIKLRVKKTSGTIHELSERCIEALQGTGWIVMIDEAELLPYRALEVMRRIQDCAHCGLLLAGMPRLLLNLMGSRGEYEQLYSRVSLALDLDDMKQLSEESDFNDILTNILKGGLPDYVLTDEVLAAFRKESGGNYRRMYKLARSVIRASKTRNLPVSPLVIEKYGKMLIKQKTFF
ncbi:MULTISPECIES: AAA family ATPase [unclassified Pantoea]|uniref:AAA family ATPase n=1 Tax=unclassified Pantoea TaxID=2630326 RepID=UPI001232E0E2|nr:MULTISPECIES: AAA family ATPase [unclassified Pantoea]KAA5957782.1 AAA family ATPase [Pantoea sp. VH_16]KAA6104660.1 AAA family ATPase [Pantoea sp. Bo_14]KAA6108036.1 AAA family ATPase [Pantoea sp. Bo_11]